VDRVVVMGVALEPEATGARAIHGLLRNAAVGDADLGDPPDLAHIRKTPNRVSGMGA
jgi:hypothetical protein